MKQSQDVAGQSEAMKQSQDMADQSEAMKQSQDMTVVNRPITWLLYWDSTLVSLCLVKDFIYYSFQNVFLRWFLFATAKYTVPMTMN